MNEKESEFGMGLAYCLGLFLAHAERGLYDRATREKHKGDPMWESMFEDEPGSWFNASSDHLYDLQIEAAPEELQPRLTEFRDKCLGWGHGFSVKPKEKATKKDQTWAIQEAKDLLRELDAENCVPTAKGTWE